MREKREKPNHLFVVLLENDEKMIPSNVLNCESGEWGFLGVGGIMDLVMQTQHLLGKQETDRSSGPGRKKVIHRRDATRVAPPLKEEIRR